MRDMRFLNIEWMKVHVAGVGQQGASGVATLGVGLIWALTRGYRDVRFYCLFLFGCLTYRLFLIGYH
jgi:hypothetical protein